ncbi:winged helix-turn-helix domain-containing protein (plasmid) [Bradyrhizobium sp. CB82]|uniref:winged helix-turn-helix domain-containing protein n=1 Tax=Bradyrhizobium sp. CB82 TaxID=3039159 RepID=UPI0024B16851|nr:winged helix-turn-helix domain-containing protein [Bradyrhizobium sp. CB82]WFU45482.1 winged helix-turn-helix domain-containing protein [Bradyrhizobium sp. CB82]
MIAASIVRRHGAGKSKFRECNQSVIAHHQRGIARGNQNHQIVGHEHLSRDNPAKAREVTMRSTLAFGRLEQFHPEPEFDVGRAVQRPAAVRSFFETRTRSGGVAPADVSFGSFRLLPTQLLLLEDDKPVSIGSRALALLIALLERRGELVSKQDLMARVWPNLFVEPANLTVHMSALRRVLRDGRDGNRFIVNIPGRGYCFVAAVDVSRHEN